MQDKLLCAEDLTKQHGAFYALRDASFCVSGGEVVGLIGPNGSSKTTLFECVAGLRAPTSGTITLLGQAVAPAQRKQRLYLVPDGIHPWASQTVQWTLRCTANIHGQSDTRRSEIARALALDPLLSSRLGELSKGEHRRVMLAIGLLTTQPLLLLDEPFDGLDLRQTREVMTLLRSQANAGRALFLSIHQLTDAARVCDGLILLSGGRIVGAGTLDELQSAAGTNSANLEEIFLALT